jgi:hypothetical protein
MISELVSGTIASQPVRKKKTDHNPLPPSPPGTHEGPHALGHPSSLQLQQDASDHKRVGPTRQSCSSRESPGPRLRSPATSGETEGGGDRSGVAPPTIQPRRPD